jgi:hypothetical protein
MTTGSETQTPFAVNCAICERPVSLAECKTDDRGLPVHEECYVAMINQKLSEKREPSTDGS